MSRLDADVAIVGFGPVGAAAALMLAESGVRVAVLERSTGTLDEPRAVGLDGESLRSFQRIGMADEVSKLLHRCREPDLVTFTNSRREPYFGLELAQFGITGWRDVAYFDQPELERLLRAAVAMRENVSVRCGSEVVGVEQDPDGVVVRSRAIDGSGDEQTLRAAYLLGCDGAASFVRRAVGIAWTSLGYDQDWLVVDIVQNDRAALPEPMMQVCDPERLVTYVPVKDPNRRWEIQLREGETRDEMLRPERIAELLAPWLPPDHYAIRRAAVYQFHAATASRWQVGRVFLAGDSAHQTPPFLGQGLNSGLRDAVNLGWKLPLVLSGDCDPELLESYAEERDAHARDLVEWAVAVGKLMETLAAREAGRPDPHAAETTAGYGQGRSIPPLRDGVLVTEQLTAEPPAGAVFSQPLMRAPGGEERLLDEWLGRGFAIVGRTRADLCLGADARRVADRLGLRSVPLEGFEVLRGNLDRAFESHPAVVVRPDRYVFGFVDEAWDLDRLLLELACKLRLREA